MSLRALHSAASGMDANAFNLDMIANNLANAGTTAFKQSRANFEDLFYEHLKLPGSQDAQGQLTPIGLAVGLGTRVAGTQVNHTQGNLVETSGELDIAIVGDGFFQVQDGNELLYTRSGRFTLNAEGQIVLASADRGRLLEPAISVPPDAESITITSDGQIVIKQPGSTTPTTFQLQLTRFVNPQGLVQVGESLFAESPASGAPQTGIPETEGRGALRQFHLEASNVEPVHELIDLIKTQRNFELNSQTVQAADQMLQLVANLRRF